MASFRTFIEDQLFVESVISEFHTDHGPTKQYAGGKPWSAKKSEIMDMWSNLRSDTPIFITPMDKDGDKDSYGEDGIRITGTWNFISGVLGRLKDLMQYESPQTKLRLIFRGIDHDRDARPDRKSFVFYVNVDRRGSGKAGRPTKPGGGAPKQPSLEPPRLPSPSEMAPGL